MLAVLLSAGSVAADTPTTGSSSPGRRSVKGRVIGTIAGAAGGFVGGVFLGLSKFDEAINSDRKVWTTALAVAAAGGIGGYFLGSTFDTRSPRDAQQVRALPLTALPTTPSALFRSAPCSVRLGCRDTAADVTPAAP